MKNTLIKKIIQQSFQELINQNFILYNNVFYKQSSDHMLWGFYFEKVNTNNDSVYVWAFAQPLFVKTDSIILTFGERLRNANADLWQLEKNLDINETISRLLFQMTASIEESLNLINTAQKFCDYFQDKVLNIRMMQAVSYSAVKSQHKNYKTILNRYIEMLKKENLSLTWMKNLLDEAEYLTSIINDCNAVEVFFQKNINHTVKAIFK